MADDSFAVASVQVSLLDDMVLGVHPVHAAASVVYGEAIGPEKVRVRNDAPVGSVHVGVLDAWRVAPVSPVDLPKHWRVSVRDIHAIRGRSHSEQKRLLFFTLYTLIICSATQRQNELNVFSSLGFLWGFFQSPPLSLWHMIPGIKPHFSTTPSLNYTDACLWALLFCQTLILFLYNWNRSTGNMYIWMCVDWKPSVAD